MEETREENLKLHEEITCLRNVLYDQDIIENTADETSEILSRENISMDPKEKLLEEAYQVRQHEFDDLREQFKDIVKENNLLRDTVNKLEKSNPSKKNKLRQAKKEGLRHDEIIDLAGNGIVDLDSLNARTFSVEEKVRLDEKLEEAEQMLNQSQEECSEMRSEVLLLTEALYNARQNYSDTINELDLAKQHNRELQFEIKNQENTTIATKNSVDPVKFRQLEDAFLNAQNEVQTKKKEIMSMEKTLFSTQEEVRLLSEEISNMSSAFEKAQYEYNSVVEELDTVHQLFEKSRRKLQEEVYTLTVECERSNADTNDKNSLDETKELLESQLGICNDHNRPWH